MIDRLRSSGGNQGRPEVVCAERQINVFVSATSGDGGVEMDRAWDLGSGMLGQAVHSCHRNFAEPKKG
jgi:hypothetical protein